MALLSPGLRSWKLIDGPALGGGNAALAGFFYDSAGAQPQPQPGQEQMAGSEPTEEMQKLIEAIQKVDGELAAAAEDKKPALNTPVPYTPLTLPTIHPV